jgi:predicted SAM-dependent methyltransferase
MAALSSVEQTLEDAMIRLTTAAVAHRYPEPSLLEGRILHLGCGTDIHRTEVQFNYPGIESTNIDLHPRMDGVRRHDVRQGLPLESGSVDLVYHKGLLSALQPDAALRLTRECHRVLKPGGILRIVTEDFANMMTAYLTAKQAAEADPGDRVARFRYDWMRVEIFDYPSREFRGGEMIKLLRRANQELSEHQAAQFAGYVVSRVGVQGKAMVASAKRPYTPPPPRTDLRSCIRTAVLNCLLKGNGPEIVAVGRFRVESGGNGYGYYDTCSLVNLYRDAGFDEISLVDPAVSQSPFWQNGLNLDVTREGSRHSVNRPDCLVMEGVRRW